MHHQAGLSLVECAIVTAITAVALGAALPSFQEARLRRQLEGTAAQLETDLQLARAEAVARNEGVRVAVIADAGDSGYLLHTGPAGACRLDGDGPAVCTDGAEALRQVRLAAGGPVQLRANSGSMLFDPLKGTVTPTGTLKLQSAAGSVHLVVNVMGRVRGCTPDAAIPGWPRC